MIKSILTPKIDNNIGFQIRRIQEEHARGHHAPGCDQHVRRERPVLHLLHDKARAAHVDHLRYGFSLMNRWTGGENPWDDADWTQSWRIAKVSEVEWKKLRADLGSEMRRWRAAVGKPREMDQTELTGVIASIVHLAYHLGAIRQIDRTARGPKA
jgi:hypothetical protein